MVIRLYDDLVVKIIRILTGYRMDHPEEFNDSIAPTEPMPMSAQEILDLLVKQLDTVPVEQDLIDHIVAILRLPYIENRINVRAIQQLRKTLLLPGELAELRNHVDGEWACASCGGRIYPGQAMTFQRSETGGAQARCWACTTPVYTTCLNGKHLRDLPKSLVKSIQKLREDACEQCQAEAVEQAEQARRQERDLVEIEVNRRELFGEEQALPGALTGEPGRGIFRNPVPPANPGNPVPTQAAQPQDPMRVYRDYFTQMAQDIRAPLPRVPRARRNILADEFAMPAAPNTPETTATQPVFREEYEADPLDEEDDLED